MSPTTFAPPAYSSDAPLHSLSLRVWTRARAVLKAHPIFATLDGPILGEIAKAMRTHVAKPDEIIIKKGEAGEHFFVVSDGECQAFLSEDASGAAVATYHTHDSFGELALLYDSPRAATVKATKVSKLYKLGRIQFRNLVMEAMQKGKAGLEERLRQVALLAGLSAQEISRLAEAMEPETFKDGDYIETMGAPADSLSIILSGEVACHKDDGQELRLAEGAIFGELPLKHLHKAGEPPAKRQAHVVAVGEVRCAGLSANHITDILGPLQQALDLAFMRKVLCSVEIFAGLDPGELSALLTAMESKHVMKGETVITQGQKGDHVLRRQDGQRRRDGGAGRRLRADEAHDAQERRLLRRALPADRGAHRGLGHRGGGHGAHVPAQAQVRATPRSAPGRHRPRGQAARFAAAGRGEGQPDRLERAGYAAGAGRGLLRLRAHGAAKEHSHGVRAQGDAQGPL